MKIKLKPSYIWPSGIDRALFSANIDIEELAKKYKLPFVRHEEVGMGWYSNTLFSLEDIECVGVVEYDRSPAGSDYGATIHIDFGIEPVSALAKICEALDLNESDLTWVNDDAKT